jgi:hypothetical protein
VKRAVRLAQRVASSIRSRAGTRAKKHSESSRRERLGCPGATRSRRCGCAEDLGEARQHLLFCQQDLTERRASGNGGVPSSRDNVPSSFGGAVQARADTATASINAVGDQDRVDGSTQVKPR